MNLFKVLKERGFIEQVSHDKFEELLGKQNQTIYIGFDPTSDSLHLGHMIPLMVLKHAQLAGHRPIALVGGATAMIGDPSGKSEERNLLGEEEILSNVKSLKKQISRFIDFSDGKALLLNNYDWLGEITLPVFLREVGKHFSLGSMLAKESVKKRVEGGGLSFTEFTYQILQAYDFYHLNKHYDCNFQGGGNDQWGNITAGIELTRRKSAKEVYGLTFPLLTTSTGEKFGKSAGNAVWLDRQRTSVWDFYQYWINTADKDVIRFLKLFSFLPMEKIASLEKELAEQPHLRSAQKALAAEMTSLVHGEEETKKMQEAAQALFSGKLSELPTDVIIQVLGKSNGCKIKASELDAGLPLVNLLADTKLTKSRGEARRKIKESAISLNDKKVSEELTVSRENILKDNIILLRMGKRKYGLVEVV